MATVRTSNDTAPLAVGTVGAYETPNGTVRISRTGDARYRITTGDGRRLDARTWSAVVRLARI
jgi:hypothetical protein